MAILTYDQIMYAWNNVTNALVTLNNVQSSTYYSGNFKGAHYIPSSLGSARLAKGTGTTKYDITPYVKDDETYIIFVIKGSGMTTALVTGNIKLYFADGFSGTIQQAVDAGKIDPIAFRYTSMSSTSYTWNTGNLFTGGQTDSKNYPYANIYVRPINGNRITHFEFYTNKALNTTYDGFIVYQTNIINIATTAEDAEPKSYEPSGEYITQGISLATLQNNLKLFWESVEPPGTSITVSIGVSNLEIPTTWFEQVNGSIVTDLDTSYSLLFIKCVLATTNSLATPVLKKIWLEDLDMNKSYLILEMNPLTGSFKNVEGELVVSYDKTLGSLEGIGGTVESFTRLFVSTGLQKVPNPLFEENIKASIPLTDFSVVLNSLMHYIIGIGTYPTTSVQNQGGAYLQEPTDDLNNEKLKASIPLGDFTVTLINVADINP